MSSIYWVGGGQLLVTLKNGRPLSLNQGDEITKEYLDYDKEKGRGLSPDFIEHHKKLGNISNLRAPNKAQSGNRFAENRVSELQKENEKLRALLNSPAESEEVNQLRALVAEQQDKISELEALLNSQADPTVKLEESEGV